jgi:hypothetical protein
VGPADRQHNGVTGAAVTGFFVRGDSERVRGFLSLVCARLRDLPAERIEIERTCCEPRRAVAAGLSPTCCVRAGSDRPRMACPDTGSTASTRLTVEDVRAWSAHWFTRGNAALWLVGGPPPAGARLDLTDGPRRPTPAPSSTVVRTSAYLTADIDGVGLEAVVPRGGAAAAYAEVLRRQLTAVLRGDLGLSYAVDESYQPLAAGTATVTVMADALPDARARVVAPFLDVVVDLARGRVSPDDLAAVRTSGRDELADPTTAVALAQSGAASLLKGDPEPSIERWRAELDDLTTETVAEVAVRALDTALVVVPHGQAVGRAGFIEAPSFSAAALAGRSYVPATGHGRQRLIVGTDGVSVVDGPKARTVRYDDCAGVVAYPDGGRVLFGTDGTVIPIEPTLWKLPAVTLNAVTARVPADRVARMADRDPASIPQPAGPDQTAPAGHPADRRPMPAWVRGSLIGAAAVAVLLVTVVAAVSASPMAAIGAFILGVGAVRYLRERLPRREGT